MTTPHRTLQMALDALDAITDDVDGTGLNTMPSFDKAIDAITALREALAAPEPEPEPVAWCELTPNGSIAYFDGKPMVMCGPVGNECHTTPLCAAPPAAPATAVPAEDFCYCNDEISLQMVSGGAASEGLYGRLTLKIDGKYVEYVRAESAAPPAAPAPAAPVVPAVPLSCNKVPPGNGYCDHCARGEYEKCRYTTPAAPVPLTDEQIDKILERERMKWATSPPTYEFAASFARAIEAALGITGGKP